MMSVDLRDGVRASPVSRFPRWVFSFDASDGVPRVFGGDDVLSAFSPAIGHGGDRGSLVYALDALPEFRRHFGVAAALKVYPERVSANEAAFVRAVLAAEGGLCRHVPYLVRPMALAVVGGAERGVLMPQLDGSLRQRLLLRPPPPRPEAPTRSSLRTRRAFAPVASLRAVTAVAFQLFVAVAALHEELPHTAAGRRCRGFTHNDVHLGNVLVRAGAGHVALGDFELVAPIPADGDGAPNPHAPPRLPPYCRQCPSGLFRREADVWAMGLLLAALLTGVDPLFDDEKLLDDFGSGPLLLGPGTDAAAARVDWDANIGAHVEEVMRWEDPSGERLRDAQPLLALCGKCLVNREGAAPRGAMELLTEPIFAEFLNDPRRAEEVLREWFQSESQRGRGGEGTQRE